MKPLKLTFSILVLLVNTLVFSFAQAPQKVSYQMVVRDATGALVKESAVGVQISILQGSAEGTAVYVETHTSNTNVNGLVSIEVGNGSPVTNTFAGIDWANGSYFLKVETDPAGGINYSIAGTSEILSVPYALFTKTAETAETATGTLLQEISLLKNTVKSGGGLYDYRDGNYYNTVKIGNQVWMAENLRYLPVVHSNAEFETQGDNSQPGYGVYGYDGSDVDTAKSQANYTTYGVLYNWYAVNSGTLAPVGWHIPTDAEWTVLENYLITNGYNYDGTLVGNKIAKSLASKTNWELYTTEGIPGNAPENNNSTGFTALPGGFRDLDGAFDGVGYYGYWWSSTEYDGSYAYLRGLVYDGNDMYSLSYYKESGVSVRLVRD